MPSSAPTSYGKARRQRRPPATPYSRPPSAARGLRPLAAPDRGTWISKLVDPASRIIGWSASRLFSSVFRKRLAAPPEENHLSNQEVNAASHTKPLMEVGQQGGNDAENKRKNSNFDGAKQKGTYDADGIVELEQLLKQKTFTRAEFNRLSELVRTRTVEPITLQPAVFGEKKENATVVMQEKGVRCNGSDRAISSSLKSPIAEEELGSVEELFTPYMGSICSIEPSSALSLRNQIFKKDVNLPCNVPHEKGSNHPRTPRSVHFSGIPEVPENGHLTSRPVGRSAMHRMACSPYFKSSVLTSNRVGELHRDSNAGPSASSQLMLTNFMQSNDKQVHKRGSSVLDEDFGSSGPVHKRGSSVLDEDFGSSGPVRRIRRKSNLMSSSKDIRSLHTKSVVPTPSSPMSEDIGRWLDVSIQNPRYLDRPEDESRNVRQEENGDAKDPFRSSLSPPDSSKLIIKTVEQPDKLFTSHLVNSSISKSIARDESLSGLTVNMLNEQALKSMKDIDSARFFTLPGSDQNGPSVPDAPSLKTSKSQNLHRVEGNNPSKPVLSGVKVTHGTAGTAPVILTAGINPGSRTNSLAISGSAKVPSHEKPAFKMAAPEDFWDFDDDDNATGDTPDTTAVVNDKVEQKKLEGKNKTSETEAFEKSAASSSGSLPTSSGSLLEADVKASFSPVLGKDISSLFHVSSAPVTSSQSPQTPVVPFPLFDIPSSQNDQIAAPGFLAGSQESHTPVPITANISDSASLKSNESTVSTTALPGLNDAKSSKVGDILGSSEDAAASPIISTSTSPLVMGLGTSAIPKLSNGSFTSALSTSSVSPTTGALIPVSTSVRESKSIGLEGSTAKASPFGSSVIFSETSAMLNTSSNSAALATSVSSSTSNILPSATTSSLSSLGTSASALFMPPAGLKPANGTFGVSASLPQSEPTAVAFGTTAGSTSGTEATQTGKQTSEGSTQTGKQTSEGSSDKGSQFGSFAPSPAFGPAGFPSSGSDSSQLASADLKPFGSSIAASSSQTSTLPVFGSSTAAPSTGFSFGQSSATSNSQPPASIFGSSTSLPASGFTFGTSAPASAQSSSASVFGSSSTLPSTGLSFGESAPASTSQSSSVFGSSTSVASAGFKFGQSSALASSQSSSTSVFGSSSTLPSTGLSTSTSQFSTSVFNSSTSLPPTKFSFGQAVPASSSQPSSSLFGSGASLNSNTSLLPTGFSFGQSAPTSSSQPSSSVFGSGTSLSSMGFSSIPASSSQPSSSSVFGSMTSPSTGFTFGQPISASSAQPSTPSMFGSSTSSANTGFSFGQSVSTSGTSFNFGAASGSAFSFPSAGTTASAFASPAPPMFGAPAPAAGFSSGFSGSGQINMEDSMADDTTQAAPPMVPTFGQPANSLATPNFNFGSPANPTGGSSVFQFATQQSPVPQNPSPFQTGGNLEYSGGSFSLGSAGGDKSNRKIVKINRNKLRKK